MTEFRQDSYSSCGTPVSTKGYDLRIYLDMDCVLADFIRGVADVMQVRHSDLLSHWTPGVYGFGHAVAAAYRACNLRTEVSSELAEQTFWKIVDGNPAFWSELTPLPWCELVLQRVGHLDPDFRLLTSPSDCGQCLVGKHRWLKRMGADPSRMIPTKYKHELARKGRVLIDDYTENVTAWEREGGTGLLFPALHNKRFAEVGRAWDVVRLELDMLFLGGAT